MEINKIVKDRQTIWNDKLFRRFYKMFYVEKPSEVGIQKGIRLTKDTYHGERKHEKMESTQAFCIPY
jgi:hypothetical protein